MVFISKKRYEELKRKEEVAEEQRIIIEEYAEEFRKFCDEYDIVISYHRERPSHNFSMIKKIFLELFIDKTPRLIGKYNFKVEEQNERLKEELIYFKIKVLPFMEKMGFRQFEPTDIMNYCIEHNIDREKYNNFDYILKKGKEINDE